MLSEILLESCLQLQGVSAGTETHRPAPHTHACMQAEQNVSPWTHAGTRHENILSCLECISSQVKAGILEQQCLQLAKAMHMWIFSLLLFGIPKQRAGPLSRPSNRWPVSGQHSSSIHVVDRGGSSYSRSLERTYSREEPCIQQPAMHAYVISDQMFSDARTGPYAVQYVASLYVWFFNY